MLLDQVQMILVPVEDQYLSNTCSSQLEIFEDPLILVSDHLI